MKAYYLTLADHHVKLVPLSQELIRQMRVLSSDKDVWTWYTEDLSDPDDLEQWMLARLEASNRGDMMSYAVVDKATDSVIGSTSYGHIDWTERCIEIGWTWLGKAYIGTGVNKHMKYLMLRHAFDVMDIQRLELRTDEKNLRSRRAMEKIGATYDGTLRNHRSTQGGKRRNTVIYSIIRSEWKDIKDSIFAEF